MKTKLLILIILLLGIGGTVLYIRSVYSNVLLQNITVGVYCYPPFAMKDPKTGRYTGFDIELLEAVAKYKKINLIYKDLTFSDIFTEIPAGKIDMATTITILLEREKHFRFSWPCMETGLALAVRGDDVSITEIENLKGKTLGTFPGTGETYSRELEKKGKVKKIFVYEDSAELYEALVNGSVDAVIGDYAVNCYYGRKLQSKIKCFSKLYQYSYLGFPLGKSNEVLMLNLNDGIKNIISSGEYIQLHRKYFKNLKTEGNSE
ncbi:MAG: hypothetical protein A2017_11860 [Lentisphaerae bacterium GWF2_44_16]|nr:MAG: hypothetical protein A2017_11860 [Lentisphaerae bacterium GWF2_44_16]